MYRLKEKATGDWLESAKKSHHKVHYRWVARGSFGHKDKAGGNTVHFSGRLKGKALRSGRYRLNLVAGLSGLHSAPIAKTFAVARSHH